MNLLGRILRLWTLASASYPFLTLTTTGATSEATLIVLCYRRPDETRAEAYAAARLRKTDFESEFRIVLPDGANKNIHNIGHPILDESGEILEFVGASIDVTEHRRARADLEKAFEEIKRLKDQ